MCGLLFETDSSTGCLVVSTESRATVLQDCSRNAVFEKLELILVCRPFFNKIEESQMLFCGCFLAVDGESSSGTSKKPQESK